MHQQSISVQVNRKPLQEQAVDQKVAQDTQPDTQNHTETTQKRWGFMLKMRISESLSMSVFS